VAVIRGKQESTFQIGSAEEIANAAM